MSDNKIMNKIINLNEKINSKDQRKKSVNHSFIYFYFFSLSIEGKKGKTFVFSHSFCFFHSSFPLPDVNV